MVNLKRNPKNTNREIQTGFPVTKVTDTNREVQVSETHSALLPSPHTLGLETYISNLQTVINNRERDLQKLEIVIFQGKILFKLFMELWFGRIKLVLSGVVFNNF